MEAEDEQIVKASTDYVTHIHASVESGNVFACQFHPEKSGDVGLQILKILRHYNIDLGEKICIQKRNYSMFGCK